MSMEPNILDRQTLLPLILGGVMGIVMCVGVVPTAARSWLQSHGIDAVGRTPETARSRQTPDEPTPPEPDEQRQPPLGDDEPHAATVAWISYDDYRRMLAPEGETVQPAVQRSADPVARAPLDFEATPPKQMAADEAAEATQAAAPASGGRRRPQVDEQKVQEKGLLAMAAPGPRVEDGSRPAPADGNDRPQPVDDARPPAAKRAEWQRPTAAPRADREASPVSIDMTSKIVRAGGVVTAQGIRIQTVAPRITAVTYITALRSGARIPVRVLFNSKGEVTKAQLRQRAGYPEVDTPVRASLYRWRASGKRLEQMNRPFELAITLNIGIGR